MSQQAISEPIDSCMEQACQAIAQTDYFQADRLCMRALSAARRVEDFERMARICLPLQEARRQLREEAFDRGPVALVRTRADLPKPLIPGCYFLMPPMIGRDGRTLRETASRRGIAVSVLTREPLTRKGLWPIVGVGALVVRVQIEPPWPIGRAEDSVSKDRADPLAAVVWFAAASYALGQAALDGVGPGVHPHGGVGDVVVFLCAHPADAPV